MVAWANHRQIRVGSAASAAVLQGLLNSHKPHQVVSLEALESNPVKELAVSDQRRSLECSLKMLVLGVSSLARLQVDFLVNNQTRRNLTNQVVALLLSRKMSVSQTKLQVDYLASSQLKQVLAPKVNSAIFQVRIRQDSVSSSLEDSECRAVLVRIKGCTLRIGSTLSQWIR